MKKLLRYHESYVFLAVVVLAAVITVINPSFFTLENFFDMCKSYSVMGIFAVGVFVVIVSGGIDISFTAIATVAEYVMAVAMISHGGGILGCLLIACAVGVLLGLINALLIHFFRMPTIIATIATLNIFYGILVVLSGGKWLYNLPSWFRDFALIRVFSFVNNDGIRYGLSIITLMWIALVAIAWFIMRHTILGRSIYALGGNEHSARRAGINLLRVRVFVYSFTGLTAGIAGMAQALLVQTVAPNSLVGKELDVIAAVVLGGASIAGGGGTLTGTILGVALIAIMSNGLTLMRVSAFWYNVLIGLVILISVGVSAIRRRQSQARIGIGG
jgi:simple sugar transport system permease protein